jgi:hypothetical protein
MAGFPQLRRRRAVALGVSFAVPAVLVFGFGHRGVHMARNLLVPGAGLLDERLFAGLLFVGLAVAATVAWMRWGVDWAVVAVVVAAMAASAVLTSPVEHAVGRFDPVPAAHEFPLVLLVVGAMSWLRSVAGRTPVVRHLSVRRSRSLQGLDDLCRLPPVDRCRAVSVLALAADGGTVPTGDSIDAADVAARARRIGLVARGRVGRDPFRVDHAHARTAMLLTDRLDPDALDALVTDARRATLGVPCSEPGWVRPLDATLVAVALHRHGHEDEADVWARAFEGEFALRRGHRPAWWWTPLGIGAGSMPAWEHAATTALARSMGWVGDDDWAALRAPALGASARGVGHPADERLIAAARIWLAFVDDPVAARLLARPTVRHDPMAVALDRLAERLAADDRFVRPERNLTP